MTENWQDIAKDIRRSPQMATAAIVEHLFNLGYSKTGHPLAAAITMDIQTTEGDFTPDVVAKRLFDLGYRKGHPAFVKNQAVRVVTGYEGVPNLFAEGFTPEAGMTGTIDEVPEESESMLDDLGNDIPAQYVVDFGGTRWDTFTVDELEAL